MSKPKLLGLCAFYADLLSLNVKSVRLFVFVLALFFPRPVLIIYLVCGLVLRISQKWDKKTAKKDSNPYDSSANKEDKDDFDDDNYMKF